MTTPGPEQQPTTRDRLIGATEELLRTGGLAAVTTQSVARTAGCAEGTIYRHFDCRDALIASAIGERIPKEFDHVVDELVQSAGTATVKDNIATFVAGAVPFFRVIAPLFGMMAANKELAARQYEMMRAKGRGPRRGIERLEGYFRDEQGRGRVRADIDPRAAAGLLMGICFHRSLLASLFGEDPIGIADDDLPAAVATTLARGLEA